MGVRGEGGVAWRSRHGERLSRLGVKVEIRIYW